MNKISQDLVIKYFNALQIAKNDAESNIFNVDKWESKCKVSNRTMATLRNLGIIKNLGSRRWPSYQWNSKIPVTMLLAKKVILENAKIQAGYKNKVAKPIVKRASKQILPIVDKTKIDRFTNQEPKHNQVGLIRRFLKWIY